MQEGQTDWCALRSRTGLIAPSGIDQAYSRTNRDRRHSSKRLGSNLWSRRDRSPIQSTSIRWAAAAAGLDDHLRTIRAGHRKPAGHLVFRVGKNRRQSPWRCAPGPDPALGIGIVTSCRKSPLCRRNDGLARLLRRHIAATVPIPSAEVAAQVDREPGLPHGVDTITLVTAVQLLTNGVVLGNYLPDHADDEVEIRLRYPAEDRTFAQLADLRISTPAGMVPIANFVDLVDLVASPAASVINRIDSENVQTVSSALTEGATVTQELQILEHAVAEAGLPEGVAISFVGEIEDQEESLTFLVLAFVVAIFLMFLILLTQLNSIFQSLLVLSAIVFSIAGVFLGLVIRQEAFSIVMSGIGIVALAGIVVNNNIVLIDAYNEYRDEGVAPNDAAFRAGAERFRPVLLTAVTTMAGLMPMVLGMTVDFIDRDLFFGAPSGQFWTQLSTAIVGGLAFATFITVLLTPAMLAWDGNRRERRAARRQRRAEGGNELAAS